MHRRETIVFLVAGDAAALLTLRPHVGRLARHLAAPHAWLNQAGADRAVATLAAAGVWCAAGWLALGLTAAAAARLPGAAGRVGRVISCRVLPRAVAQLLAGSTGLTLLLAPATAGAAPAPPVPTPSWPVDPVAVVSVPAPSWPSDRDRPASAPAPPRPGHGEVPVRPGDSLWSIARRRLDAPASDARIAQSWPRWYAANRATIGADPGLIRPGQLLRPPHPVAAPERRP
jgi:hypothetical protein